MTFAAVHAYGAAVSPTILTHTVQEESLLGRPLVAGVDLAMKPSALQSFWWPTNGPTTSFQDDSHPLGIDVGLALDPHEPIVASARGTVTFAGGSACCSYGRYVIIDHGYNISTLYAHLSRILVAEGEQVEQGQRIGLGGTTGNSTSEHLHFELRDGEEHLNPLRFLPHVESTD